jgi:hypothetical protein
LDPSSRLGDIGQPLCSLKKKITRKILTIPWMFLLYVKKKIDLTRSIAWVNNLVVTKNTERDQTFTVALNTKHYGLKQCKYTITLAKKI